MSTAIYSPASQESRDARAAIRAATAHAGRASASALNEVREIVLTLAGALAIMVVVLALDVWIWVPQAGH
jgi:hypothetical protein